MRVHEKKVFTFDELDGDAKERAREWYRDGAFDYEWWDGVYESATTAARILGIDLETRRARPAIYFSGFCSQGDGARFEGSYAYARNAKRAIEKEFPQDVDLRQIAADLQDAQKRHFYRLEATIGHQGHYDHEGTMDIDVFDREDNYQTVNGEAVEEALRDFARWIFKSLEAEYEYLNSDGVVDESLEANEYEFDDTGRPA